MTQGEARPTAGSRTPHFNVSCQTCRVSKTFVTLQGVNMFFLDHDGHKVIEGTLFERPQFAKEAEPVVEEVSKPQEEVPEVAPLSRDVIAQEIKPQVKEAAEAELHEETPALPQQGVQPAERHMEALVERLQSSKKTGAVSEEVSRPAAGEAQETRAGRGNSIFLEFKPQMEEEADVLVQEEAPTPILQVLQPAEVRPKGPVAAPLPLVEKDVKEPLLLARSSYIEDSEEMRLDAARVSRVLKEFKWNVEPPYVIGVMVDSNLSVETNVGVISDAMVEKVESLGYKFVAVNAPQGSPVAWFKRQGANLVGDAEKTMKIGPGTLTSEKDKAVWQASFVSLLMTVKDMNVQNLQRATNMIKTGQPEPDIQP